MERRDQRQRARFVFAVETTGTACRPGCPARTPNRENVAFFDTLGMALRAGSRPCKRCRPERVADSDGHLELVAAACRAIATGDASTTLASLARSAGMSPWHFQRVFKRAMGMSPKQYAEIARALGEPTAARAVAGACAATAVAIVIPSHRVVRSDGTPGGYRWGVERERAETADRN